MDEITQEENAECGTMKAEERVLGNMKKVNAGERKPAKALENWQPENLKRN